MSSPSSHSSGPEKRRARPRSGESSDPVSGRQAPLAIAPTAGRASLRIAPRPDMLTEREVSPVGDGLARLSSERGKIGPEERPGMVCFGWCNAKWKTAACSLRCGETGWR